MMRIAIVSLAAVACSKGPTQVDLGQPVHPFGVVSGVWLGMTKNEARQKAPQLSPVGDGDLSTNLDGDNYLVRLTHGRVFSIEMELRNRPAADLWNAWGHGHVYDAFSSHQRRHYIDELRGARADVSIEGYREGFTVKILPMTPLAKLLGAGPDATSVAAVKILGSPINEVAKDLVAHGFKTELSYGPGDAIESGDAELPASEWTAGELTTLHFTAGDDGLVNRFAITTGMDPVPEAKTATLAVYEHKWGKPVEMFGDLVYGHNPTIEVDPNRLVVSVTAESLRSDRDSWLPDANDSTAKLHRAAPSR